MTQIKQHTLQSGERILLFKTPEGSYDFSIDCNLFNGISFMVYENGVNTAYKEKLLDDVDWQLIGLSDEITEEQAKQLFGNIYTEEQYNKSSIQLYKKKFHELMQSLGCYDVNPYGEKPTFSYEFGEEGPTDSQLKSAEIDFEECINKWQEAQSKVGRYAVLKEVK